MPAGTKQFLTPEAPANTLALTNASATMAVPKSGTPGRAVELTNQSTGNCFVNFGPTASTSTGYFIGPSGTTDPIMVPEGETQLSAILDVGTGTLRATFVIFR